MIKARSGVARPQLSGTQVGQHALAVNSFDHYARLVRRLLDVPVALVTMIEPGRQVFPGMSGLREPYCTTRETPLSHSFCKYVVHDAEPLLISDARTDLRLADNPAVAEFDTIAYAGWPLVDTQGVTVGSLCAIDSMPREWTPDQVEILRDLAFACSAELQAMERQIRESENLTRAIFECVDVALAFFDTDNNLVMANSLGEKFAEAAGFTLDEPPYSGLHVRTAGSLSPIPHEQQIIPRALRGELEHHDMEWIGPPGSQFAVIATAQDVLRTDGTRWGTLVAAHDVTDLARSLQVKEEFVTTVSHELRTPLASIIGYLEVLDDELDPGRGFVADTLETITRNALRLRERVEQLLDAADRRRNLSLESTDVAMLIRRASNTFGEETRTAGIELVEDAPLGQFAVVDPLVLEQAVENLVSNAIKYTGEGGRVLLTVRSGATSVEVAVADNGIGMSPDEVAQACDSFWRSAKARDSAVQGIGIGLTCARDIVEAHHGSIDITSEVDQGTTVTLTLPRDSASAVQHLTG